jgi:hypothetical protein
MSNAIIFVYYITAGKTHRVPLVTFSNNLEEALILFEKKFIKVKVDTLEFAKWDL